MNKKAFTLVELIAVVVIMSIIALIATQNIVKISSNSKKESYAASVRQFINKAGYMYNQEKYRSSFDSEGKINLSDIKGIDPDALVDSYGCDFLPDSTIKITDATVDSLPVRSYTVNIKSSCDDEIHCVNTTVTNVNYIDKEIVDQNCT